MTNSTLSEAAASARLDRPKPPLHDGDRFLTRIRNRGNVGLFERLSVLFLLCDAAATSLAMLLAYAVRFHTPLVRFGVPGEVYLQTYTGYFTAGALLFLFLLNQHHMYEKETTLRRRFAVWTIAKCAGLWFAIMLGVALTFKFSPPISRVFVTLSALFIGGGLVAWRECFYRSIRSSALIDQLRQNVVFVGWNRDAERLAAEFERDPASSYRLVGCVAPARARFQRKPRRGIRVFEHDTALEELIYRNSVDIVMLADSGCLRNEVISISNICEKEMVQFKVIPSYFEILVSGLRLQTVSGIPVLGVSKLPLDELANRLLKRAVDICGALTGLILSAPIIAVAGLVVYLESPGSIFYRQRRLGRRGAEFHIIKVRSMRLDAEKDGKAGWSRMDDPRRLRCGAFLRRWNIDELPQFWNVLKGEMTLVGPRPERPELIRNFKEAIPHYNARHNAKPGITGWAQVKGLRGDTDLTERIKCDLWYLENWSLLLDLQIILMTFTSRANEDSKSGTPATPAIPQRDASTAPESTTASPA